MAVAVNVAQVCHLTVLGRPGCFLDPRSPQTAAGCHLQPAGLWCGGCRGEFAPRFAGPVVEFSSVVVGPGVPPMPAVLAAGTCSHSFSRFLCGPSSHRGRGHTALLCGFLFCLRWRSSLLLQAFVIWSAQQPNPLVSGSLTSIPSVEMSLSCWVTTSHHGPPPAQIRMGGAVDAKAWRLRCLHGRAGSTDVGSGPAWRNRWTGDGGVCHPEGAAWPGPSRRVPQEPSESRRSQHPLREVCPCGKICPLAVSKYEKNLPVSTVATPLSSVSSVSVGVQVSTTPGGPATASPLCWSGSLGFQQTCASPGLESRWEIPVTPVPHGGNLQVSNVSPVCGPLALRAHTAPHLCEVLSWLPSWVFSVPPGDCPGPKAGNFHPPCLSRLEADGPSWPHSVLTMTCGAHGPR